MLIILLLFIIIAISLNYFNHLEPTGSLSTLFTRNIETSHNYSSPSIALNRHETNNILISIIIMSLIIVNINFKYFIIHAFAYMFIIILILSFTLITICLFNLIYFIPWFITNKLFILQYKRGNLNGLVLFVFLMLIGFLHVAVPDNIIEQYILHIVMAPKLKYEMLTYCPLTVDLHINEKVNALALTDVIHNVCLHI